MGSLHRRLSCIFTASLLVCSVKTLVQLEIGHMPWNSLQFQKYLDAAEEDKKRYIDELTVYQQSEQYQDFLNRKRLRSSGTCGPCHTMGNWAWQRIQSMTSAE